MAGPYTFDPLWAADPSSEGIWSNAGIVTLYDPADAARAPVALRTPNGLAYPNPVQVDERGFAGSFVSDDFDRLAWSDGTISGFLTSYNGIKDEAVRAATSAESARSAAAASAAAAAASAAASGTGGGTGGLDESAVASAITREGSPVNAAVDSVIAQSGGGANIGGFMVLSETAPVPAGTKSGTIIFRTAAPVVVTPTDPTPAPSSLQAFGGTSDVGYSTPQNYSGFGPTVLRPSGVKVGDLLIAAVTHQNQGDQTTEPWINIPAGWVKLTRSSAGNNPIGYRPTALFGYAVTTQAILSALPNSWKFEVRADLSSVRGQGLMFRVEGANLTAPVVGSTDFRQNGGQATQVVDPMVFTGSSVLQLVVFAYNNSANVADPAATISGMTKVAQYASNNVGAGNTGIGVFAATRTASVPQLTITSPTVMTNAGAASIAIAPR